MSLITPFLLKETTSLWPADLPGVQKIAPMIFYTSNFTAVALPIGCKDIGFYAFGSSAALTTLYLPRTITRIGTYAFTECSALSTVSLDVDPLCVIEGNAFSGTPYYDNATANLYSVDYSILVKAVTSNIDERVINLADGCGIGAFLTVDSQLVLPDRIQQIAGSVGGSPTTYVVGPNVAYMGKSSVPTGVTMLVCRQPADLAVWLPSDTLYDSKNAISMAIYTDNEAIRAYDWAADNVTPTFYPLSEAPV